MFWAGSPNSSLCNSFASLTPLEDELSMQCPSSEPSASLSKLVCRNSMTSCDEEYAKCCQSRFHKARQRRIGNTADLHEHRSQSRTVQATKMPSWRLWYTANGCEPLTFLQAMCNLGGPDRSSATGSSAASRRRSFDIQRPSATPRSSTIQALVNKRCRLEWQTDGRARTSLI